VGLVGGLAGCLVVWVAGQVVVFYCSLFYALGPPLALLGAWFTFTWVARGTSAVARGTSAGGVVVAHIVLAIAIGIVGVFFFASGFQSALSFNWFGQMCTTGLCIHPEWIAIGAGLIACGVAVFFLLRKPSQT
jgi:hypothetical protein